MAAAVLIALTSCGDDEGGDRRVTASARDTATTTTSTTTTSTGEETTTTTETTTATGQPNRSTTTSGKAATSTTTTTAAAGPATTTTTTSAAAPAAVYPKDAGTPDRRVRLTLTLERTEIPTKGVFTVENTSGEEVAVERGGCDFVWGLYRNGAFVGGHEPMACPAYLRYDRLKPGETRRYEMTFDGLDDREPRKPLAPGTYDAFAGWDVTGGHWYAQPVTVTVR